MAKRRKSFKVAPRVMAAVIGGYAGSQLTNVLQNRVPFLATNKYLAPGATLLLGTGLAMRSRDPRIKEGAMGAAIVAGVELLEHATSGLIAGIGGGGAPAPDPVVEGQKQSVWM
jgi:hypothetical protein